MTGTDVRGILLSLGYVLAVLLIADWVRRRGVPVAHSRKAVHIAVGMWVFPTLVLFDRERWYWAVVPPLLFAVLNALSLRYRFFQAIEIQERTLGTVYFPISFAGLLALFWPAGYPEIAAAGLMAMTWGDALASIVGQAYGQRSYTLWGQRKTWLGSFACFSWTFLAITLTLRFLGAYSPPGALLHAALAGLGAAIVEAFSPKGTDNLTVPIATAGILYLLAVL